MKKMYLLKILNVFLIFLVFCQHDLIAQSVVITGKVSSSQGNPLSGVTIKEKGGTGVTSTKEGGHFTISISGLGKSLVFTSVGYITKEVAISSSNEVSVILDENSSDMDEVVIIGYQNIQRRKTTGAISTVKGKDFENTPYATFDAMLQGRVAGLAVMSTSGEPGTNNIVNIRGSSNLGLANNVISAPLYVIDNIIYDVNDFGSAYGANPLQSINPNDIESVDILKDASASAIYGARAANGVIIVKTKRPSTGKPEVRVSAYAGIADMPAMKPIQVGAAERRLKMNMLYVGGQDQWFANNQISMMLTDSLNPAFNNNTDWQGLFLRSAQINNINASVGSSSDRFTYRFSAQRYYEEGVMIGYENDNITPRLLLQVRPTDNVEIETNLFAGITRAKHGSGEGVYGSKYPFTTWGFPSSFWQITDVEEGVYTGRYDDLMDNDRTTSINGNTAVTLKKVFVPELSFRTQFSYNINNNTRDLFQPALITSNRRNWARSWVYQNQRWELESFFNYNKTLKEIHNISGVLGYGMEQNNTNNRYLSGYSDNSSVVKSISGISSGSDLYGWSDLQERARVSVFGRLSYDYKGKYLVSGSYRQDASSRYSRDNRWGIFPAISAGWILTEERFFEPLKSVVSFLKFRSSYGLTGLDPGSYYAQYMTLGFNGNYEGARLDNGDNVAINTYNGVGVTYPNYGGAASASSIKWERTPQFNIGFDANFIKDRINVTADYYIRNSQAMVFESQAPLTTGFSALTNNFVDIRNSGVELTINTFNLRPESAFQWNTNFNIAFNKNMVTKLPNGGREFRTGPPWMERTLNVGQPLFPFQVWKVDGVFATDADVPIDPLTGNRLRNGLTGQYYKAGDPAPQDINDDYIIDYQDKVSMGDPNPKVTGGFTNFFSYKGFTLQVLITFIQGRSLWNGYLSDRLQDAGSASLFSTWGSNSAIAGDFNVSDFWLRPGDQARYPNLFSNTVENWHIAQDYFVENASFVRLKNIQFGYSLPQSLASKLKLRSLRVFGMVDNLYIKSWSDTPDPEAVEPNGYSTGNGYPIPKKFTVGIDLLF
ncbi:SusC/RagA family TonB-linked outer membrane protein [Sphingobacterium alkalisoli]|uniref:SusC/RagA family TonB-linked outer membrane protein n=1 Tax=Sphingobacterium alkalisoli TaxID=1874115 RepID=A0A4U0GWU9_9SPHI|nr:SusC/RagA family TonB-linked outer membrane protein [Sphingobacterium alkalisoli]TJY63518.1 SusC/RagA family TonB-linked outer membrane protein [Sphingobacterium alkalisoli]GGH26586.1 SusC/RagA family TonB-linked outer membrane protein [Sphingobacterium alkalisoli]